MPLPDERPRASVGNLVARFEKKVVPDAAGPTPSPRPLGDSGSFSTYNGTPPSWMKKKDAVSPPSGSENVATSASVAAAVVAVAPAVPAVNLTSDDPFIAPTPEPAPAPEPTPIVESLTAPEPVAGPSSDQPTPFTKPIPATTPSTKPTMTASKSKPAPNDSPKRSLITQMVKSTKVPPAPRTSALNKSTSVQQSSSTSSLSKAKSTSSLKTTSTSSARFTAPTAASLARTAGDAPIAMPLKPQHTGTSTTSTSRRAVVTPSSFKTVPFPATSPSSAPKPRAALFAPTASSLAKARNVEDPMVRKPNAPPSSYSPRSTGRPRSGSTGSGSTTALKPLHLPTKSSVSASGSTRRMVSVPRQPKVEHVKETSKEGQLQPSAMEDQVEGQGPASQLEDEPAYQANKPSNTGYGPAGDLPEETEGKDEGYVVSVGLEGDGPSETLDRPSGHVHGNSKGEFEASEATFVEPQTAYDKTIQDTQEHEADIPDIESDA